MCSALGVLMPRREGVLQALEMGIEGDDEKRGKVLRRPLPKGCGLADPKKRLVSAREKGNFN